jgi:hypothetical protein
MLNIFTFESFDEVSSGVPGTGLYRPHEHCDAISLEVVKILGCALRTFAKLIHSLLLQSFSLSSRVCVQYLFLLQRNPMPKSLINK